MKYETISKLWNGELEPYTQVGKDNTEIKELEEQVRLSYEKLEKSLSEEQRVLLDKYRDSVDSYTALTAELAFCDGYCLGTKLTVQALTKE